MKSKKSLDEILSSTKSRLQTELKKVLVAPRGPLELRDFVNQKLSLEESAAIARLLLHNGPDELNKWLTEALVSTGRYQSDIDGAVCAIW